MITLKERAYTMINEKLILPFSDEVVELSPEEQEMADEDELNIHLVLTTDEARRRYLGLSCEEWDALKLCSDEEIYHLGEIPLQEAKQYLINKAKHS